VGWGSFSSANLELLLLLEESNELVHALLEHVESALECLGGLAMCPKRSSDALLVRRLAGVRMRIY